MNQFLLYKLPIMFDILWKETDSAFCQCVALYFLSFTAPFGIASYKISERKLGTHWMYLENESDTVF